MNGNDRRQEAAYGIARADEYAWRRARKLGVSRSQFLGPVAAGGGTAAAALALARLRDPNPSQAWVRWDVDWDAPRGNHKLQARATDERGYTQPAHVPNNDLG